MATQQFTQILEPSVQSHIRLQLNGVTDGLVGRTVLRTNQTGDIAIALNMYKPIDAYEKMGLSGPTPEENSEPEQRIITPRAFHVSVPTDWKAVNELNHNPRGPLSQLIINSLKETMEKEVVRSAFGQSVVGPYNKQSSRPFDSDMVVKVDATLSGQPSKDEKNVADKIVLAASKIQKNGVNVRNKNVYLAMTSEAYASLFGDDRMINRDYVHLANMENGVITHFAGFEIVVVDYLPGGSKQPCERLASGKEDTSKPLFKMPSSSTSISTSKTDPNATSVNSFALFWDKPAIETAIWDSIGVEIGKRPDKSFSTLIYGSCMVGATRTEEKRIGYIEMAR